MWVRLRHFCPSFRSEMVFLLRRRGRRARRRPSGRLSSRKAVVVHHVSGGGAGVRVAVCPCGCLSIWLSSVHVRLARVLTRTCVVPFSLRRCPLSHTSGQRPLVQPRRCPGDRDVPAAHALHRQLPDGLREQDPAAAQSRRVQPPARRGRAAREPRRAHRAALRSTETRTTTRLSVPRSARC